jgi:hydroxymethylpyrimidine/phosphomethylpyrimidine kinase
VVTPNAPEAEVLTGLPVTTPDEMLAAGAALRERGARYALMKGGHLEGDRLVDRLIGPGLDVAYSDNRIDTPHTHGTGCTLASAVATGLAQGLAVEAAVARARGYVRRAIETAPGYGSGHGPLNHAHPFERTR